MKKLVVVLVAVLGMTAPCLAAEQTHDGFFLRLAPGLGYMSATEDSPFGEMELSGGSGAFSLMVGGAVSENLILHAEVATVLADEPSVEFGGQDLGDLDGTLSTSFFGVGATYYLMPNNVYISGSIGTAESELDIDGGGTVSTDNGFGLTLSVGKEWWVGAEWGLGVAAHYLYASCDDGGEDLETNALSILFSATFN